MSRDRFVSNALLELQKANCSPIFGYQHLSISTLEEAIEKIIPLVPGVMDYALKAKKQCNQHSSILTQDESAAIYLYSMPIPFFSCLNDTLRAEKRHALKPWFAFLKLFLTALEKLPSTNKTIWRGVSGDVGSVFCDDDIHIWWSINSCSMALNIVQPFLGEKGTLFAIDAIYGKDISAYSALPDEQEVVLMPGTCVRARCQSLSFIDRLFVVHLEEGNSESEPQTEPSCLLELIKHEYQRNNRIERIMNPSKSFPIQQSYINLAIVDTKEQQEKEKKLLDTTLNSEVIGTYEEIYGTKTRIEIKNILEKCAEQTKNILVLGRAGIGKTTFCRYVAYQWATSVIWQQYTLLVFIRLRNLTENRYPVLTSGIRYSLIDLVKTEYCCHNLSKRDERFFNEQLDKNEVLWLLDGYDEIVQNIPSHLECLLEQLLKTPHHILTSRPYLNTLSYNVQLEITGFTDDNIQDYVEQFFDQIKDEIDDALIHAQKLIHFLKCNSRVWGIAHIPVNLELICSLWCDTDWSETTTVTMTTVYDKMTEWLCRRHLEKQNICSKQMTKEDVYTHCYKELKFLESLAFNGMKSNNIILRPRLLRIASRESACPLQHQPHLLNIGILKSLEYKPIGTCIEADKNHYFVHLSFQEHFAARYIVAGLNSDGEQKKKAIDFLTTDKYNQRFELVLTFTSGLLVDNENEQSINSFWNALLGEPLDLIGLRHVQIVISCLDEASCSRHLPQFRESKDLIIKWIKYSVSKEQDYVYRYIENSLRRCSSLINQPDIIDTFISLYQSENLHIKKNAYILISDLPVTNTRLDLVALHLTALNNEDAGVRRIAYNALGKMGEKAATKEVVKKFVNALEDPDDYVRWIACEAVAKLGEKAATSEVISKLLDALEDSNQYIRRNACEAFGKLGEKTVTPRVIDGLVSALGDRIYSVRMAASETLQKMIEKEPKKDVVNRLIMALGDMNVDIRANACETLGYLSDKAVTSEVIDRLISALKHVKPNVRRNACEVLRMLSETIITDEMIQRLLDALEDTNDFVRCQVCEVLGKLGKKAATIEVISRLISALDDTNSDVRREACVALETLGETVATDAIIHHLFHVTKDAKSDVRRSACEALGKLAEKQVTNDVINILIITLDDTDDNVRRSAFEALGKLSVKTATNDVVDRFLVAFNDSDNRVRRIACEAVGKMNQKIVTNEVTEKLLKISYDLDDYVRRNACEALGNFAEIAGTDKVIGRLLEALRDRNHEVRQSACDGLKKMKENVANYKVINSLKRAHNDFKKSVRVSAHEAIESIVANEIPIEIINETINALRNKNSHVKRCACKLVEELGERAGTTEVIQSLAGVLKDSNFDVRCSAWNALGEMGEKAGINAVIDTFLNVLDDINDDARRYACDAIGKMGEKVATDNVINKLVKALGDPDHNIRRSACKSLGMLGRKSASEDVINELVTLLNDTNPDVRRSSMDVLFEYGEKIATSFIIRRLLKMCYDKDPEIQRTAIETSENILCSLSCMSHFDSSTVDELSLFMNRFNRKLVNTISAKIFIEAFLNTKIHLWLPIIKHTLIYQSNAVTITDDRITLYGNNEPTEILFLDEQLKDALESISMSL